MSDSTQHPADSIKLRWKDKEGYTALMAGEFELGGFYESDGKRLWGSNFGLYFVEEFDDFYKAQEACEEAVREWLRGMWA